MHFDDKVMLFKIIDEIWSELSAFQELIFVL